MISVVLVADLNAGDRENAACAVHRMEIPEEQQAYGGNPVRLWERESLPERNVFLIREDEAVIGIGTLVTGAVDAAVWPMGTPAVQLLEFLVDVRQQGKGVGTAATRLLPALARRLDPTAAYLTLTVNQQNPGARRAYENAGMLVWPDAYLGGPAGPQDIMYIALS